MRHETDPGDRPTKKVRIDTVLLEQIELYDIFPKGMWTTTGRVNYLVSIGLGVLLEMFEKEAHERQFVSPDAKDTFNELLGHFAIQMAVERVQRLKIPRSEVAKLLDRNL